MRLIALAETTRYIEENLHLALNTCENPSFNFIIVLNERCKLQKSLSIHNTDRVHICQGDWKPKEEERRKNYVS